MNISEDHAWDVSGSNNIISIKVEDAMAGTFEMMSATGTDCFVMPVSRERAEALYEMLGEVLREKPAWMAETGRLNNGREINRGDLVVDIEGNQGVVVRIEAAQRYEDVSWVHVWQSKNTLETAFNCRVYPYDNWKNLLRPGEA